KVKRVPQREGRVSQVEGENQLPPPPQPGASPSSAAAPTLAPAQTAAPAQAAAQTVVQTATPPQKEKEPDQQADHAVPERMDMSNTLLRIRGFGDINLHGDNQRGDTTSF